MMMIMLLRLCFFCITFLLANACNPNSEMVEEEWNGEGILSKVDSAQFNRGILLFNADQGKQFWTEFNTQIRPFTFEEAGVSQTRKMNQKNPYLECVSDGMKGSYGVRFSVFETLFDTIKLPSELSTKITGVSFSAIGLGEDTLFVRVLDVQKNVLVENRFKLERNTIKTFYQPFVSENAKEIAFFGGSRVTVEKQGFGLDDVFLKTAEPTFTPPESDAAFLNWLKKASFNYFDWNYRELPNQKGIVLESFEHSDKISLSGLGYAYAAYIIAAQDGFISPAIALNRIESMLNWQLDQNWFDGTGGWHGFPHHYFKPDGSALWRDVSTIDWAMCAAGLRVVKQFYSGNAAIVQKVNTLLARPDWKSAIDSQKKIAMGFEGATGKMNPYRWGLAFSEETELVYLEAVASGQLDERVFTGITRNKKSGFYPSWFGAGFTYNWLQLWTGPMEPYKTNSTFAFKNDAETSKKVFNIPLMGLTACDIVKSTTPEGFFLFGKYISNQGGSIHGASLGEVIQISPAPYGAALGLPFTYNESMQALREYVKLGFYHEYLGLPDNVYMSDFQSGNRPVPNWNPFDINIGPIMLAIEQVQQNRVGKLFLQDVAVQNSLTKLKATIPGL